MISTVNSQYIHQLCISCEHMICNIHMDNHKKIKRPNMVSKLCTCLIQKKINVREINGDTKSSSCCHTQYHWQHPYFVGYDINSHNETIEMWRINWETLDGHPNICTFSVNPKSLIQFETYRMELSEQQRIYTNAKKHQEIIQIIQQQEIEREQEIERQKEIQHQQRLKSLNEIQKVIDIRKQKGINAYKRIIDYEKIRSHHEKELAYVRQEIALCKSMYEKSETCYKPLVAILKKIDEGTDTDYIKMEMYLHNLLEVVISMDLCTRRSRMARILGELPKYHKLHYHELYDLASSIEQKYIDYIENLVNPDKILVFRYLYKIACNNIPGMQNFNVKLQKLQEGILSNRDEYPDNDCHFICESGSNFLLPPPECGCAIICANCMIKHGGKCSSQSASCHNSLMRHLQNDVDYNDEHPTREPTRTYIVDFLEIDMFSIRELMRTHIDNVAGTAEHDEDDVDNAAGIVEYDEDDIDNVAGIVENDEDYVAGIVEFSELDVEVLANLRELVIEFFQHNKTDNEVDNLLMLAIFCNRCGYNEDYNFLFPLVGLR